MICIIGQENDPQVKLLKTQLEYKNRKPCIVNFKHFPKRKKILITDKKIVYNDINLMDMDVFYIRQLGYFWPIPQEKITRIEWIRRYDKYWEYVTAERENLSLKHSLIRMLDCEKFIVNPYDSFMYHRLKPLQIYLFKKQGFLVPDFIASNDLSKIERNKMIYKGLSGGIHAELVTDKFIKDNKNVFRIRPGLFQRYISGKNIRCYVVGNEFIGAGELISGGVVDSRIEQKGVNVIDVPEDVKEIAIKAKDILGMHFSGIDFIKTNNDMYYLLECNPSPMFYGFEHMTKIHISEKLAEYLIQHEK